MPRGGARIGAGRPRKDAPAREPTNSEIRTEARKAGLSPLDYMLAVMRNPEADQARRDKMAIAAAPFVHGKPGETAKGKKAEAEQAAKTAGVGTEWGDDLRSSMN